MTWTDGELASDYKVREVRTLEHRNEKGSRKEKSVQCDKLLEGSKGKPLVMIIINNSSCGPHV